MKNNILFIGGTHGDEPIGVRALESLSRERQDFDWLIGNPIALEAGTRGLTGDLNRSAPGDPTSNIYTERRAAGLVTKSQNYKYTIDLHGATNKTGIFIIICNPKPENFALAKRLNIKRVVYWPNFSPELNGPLCEFFPCGLEIESGSKDDPKTQTELEQILSDFLDDQAGCTEPQEYFEVYDAIRKPVDTILAEFTETTINNETFFPLLVGCYQTSGVTCYKMRRYQPGEIQ